ncbi:hypothetical protein [Gottfriedia acidiceleris]|uniref:hypothetical protein n=1 Tax=Gottfriedia acidiceleris TaxID=371036 RepID=UPI002FFDA13B
MSGSVGSILGAELASAFPLTTAWLSAITLAFARVGAVLSITVITYIYFCNFGEFWLFH